MARNSFLDGTNTYEWVFKICKGTFFFTLGNVLADEVVFASGQARKTSQPQSTHISRFSPNTVTASANCEWRICQPIQSAWFYGNRSATMAQVHNVENVLSHQTSTPEYLKRYREA